MVRLGLKYLIDRPLPVERDILEPAMDGILEKRDCFLDGESTRLHYFNVIFSKIRYFIISNIIKKIFFSI